MKERVEAQIFFEGAVLHLVLDGGGELEHPVAVGGVKRGGAQGREEDAACGKDDGLDRRRAARGEEADERIDEVLGNEGDGDVEGRGAHDKARRKSHLGLAVGEEFEYPSERGLGGHVF